MKEEGQKYGRPSGSGAGILSGHKDVGQECEWISRKWISIVKGLAGSGAEV